LLRTRETVTRATPAAFATSSIVEFFFVTRARWRPFQEFATGELTCQQQKPPLNNARMEALSFWVR
jgi:hypothetical protein